ncbi:sulfatase [Maribacter sp. HTCC2170]|uniref:sulfatase family protein n=1 Tax=Maribacter sp. (strain HTCC2170 / KCCM 42371) TaxID=313603 RepID=UPI00006B48F6|nr:sulfatase [Maribacter sp. HTCC2170]EAR01060.1 mucin-desulfating sulfatase (N-acetylglucosamine-6-sulfatase) [Maribacter sp. HTCC2170]
MVSSVRVKLFFISFLIFGFSGVIKASSENNEDPVNPKKKKPRNVIFILTDDHRYDYMGFTGKVPWLETPNMDKLAQEGAYLPNTFVTTSLCSPSRASILTGQYSHSHTIVDNQAPDPGDLTYFPEYLEKSGYQTGFFGKWHMGSHGDEPQPGFTHWESFPGQGVYYNPTLNINGERVSYKDSTYITDLLTEHTIDWLKKRDKDKPFFAYLSHKAVHAGFKPARRHKGKYKGKRIALPATYDQTKTGAYRDLKWPQWVADQRISWHGVDYMYHDNRDIHEMVVDYCETLLGVDESVGAIMDYLKKEGLDESTMVIYMGDNGFSWGEHGLIDKRHFYEESVKVPLLVRCPELFDGGGTPAQMVQNIDIAPTILAEAGIEKPKNMPGVSFTPILTGEDNMKIRKEVFYEYYWEYDFPMTPTVFGMRTDQYKYIKYHGIWDRNELYDLKNDPDEMYNLIADPDKQDIAKSMSTAIYDWMQETNGMNIPLKRTVKYRFGDYKHKNEH